MIGDVPEGLLSPTQEEALGVGVSLVIDMFLDDLFLLASDGEFQDTNMADHLPPRFAEKYSRGFARKFVVVAVTVAWKLAQPGSWPLGCVAEELALQAIVDHAEAILLAKESTENLADFLDLATKDGDYQLLFDMAWDGTRTLEKAESIEFGTSCSRIGLNRSTTRCRSILTWHRIRRRILDQSLLTQSVWRLPLASRGGHGRTA